MLLLFACLIWGLLVLVCVLVAVSCYCILSVFLKKRLLLFVLCVLFICVFLCSCRVCFVFLGVCALFVFVCVVCVVVGCVSFFVCFVLL